MARQKIREYDAKRIIVKHLSSYGLHLPPFKAILVTPETDINVLPALHPWLLQEKLVIKPDQLFGKRGKLGLVLLDASFEEVKKYLALHQNKEVTIGKATDKLTHFIVEPHIFHKKEFYLAIRPLRGFDNIMFSEISGGVNIENHKGEDENIHIWPVTVGLNQERSLDPNFLDESIDRFFEFYDQRYEARSTHEKGIAMSPPEKERIKLFIKSTYRLFLEFDFTTLDLNPFTITEKGEIIILDAAVTVDSCALFQQHQNWELASFPTPFGRKVSSEEKYIAELNEKSGASLKLTILNPKGRIWNILSGGGASVIFLDALVNLGVGTKIANYGEYSGNPTQEESYQYARTILNLMTTEKNDQGKILLIGGAIANFTDVVKTFLGIAKALTEYGDKLREHNVSIYVRRGGPNYEKGLRLVDDVCRKLGIPCQVYGPETAMTHIVSVAVGKLQQ